MAASFIQLGGDALGLDHMVDKKRMRGPISKTDLCKKETQDQVLKVKLANKLYAFTRRVIDTCVRLGIPFICENPQRSWMWDTTFFQDLPTSCNFQCIHSCMYGGQRLKKTALLLNFEANNLKLTCNGKRHGGRLYHLTQVTPCFQQALRLSIHGPCANSWRKPLRSKSEWQASFLSCPPQLWMSSNGWERELSLVESLVPCFWQSSSTKL